MTLRTALVALSVALVSALPQAHAAANDERLAAAQLLAFGRPDAASSGDAAAAAGGTLESVLAPMRARLQADPQLARTVAAKAWHDVLGTEPDAKRLDSAGGDGRLYVELVRDALQRLEQDRTEYHAVIGRAYRQAAQRDAYDIEYAYWDKRDVLPFMLLVGCIEHWAQRNAPGLMSTTGEPTISIHSRHLFTQRVSPGLAAEARALAGLPVFDGGAFAREHSVIAPGAANIVAVGGIHFLATGR